ncbi:MFS transporter [Massilia sp. DD77]|uniref:MFS transporter n=1 Tax=Massilia sp. DD77 TaxID=3109349 RepID=UPI002FFFEE52
MMKTYAGSASLTLLAATLPATAFGFALCVQISALSWILSTKYQLSLHEIGLVWAAGPVAGIIGQMAVGSISDRTWFAGGRRRPFILMSALLSASCLFLLPRLDLVADVLGIADILLIAATIALVLDLGINLGLNPARSLIADVTRQGHARARGFMYMQAMSGCWGVIAYLIGALAGNDVLINIGVAILLLFTFLPCLLIKEPRALQASTPHLREMPVAAHPQLGRIWIAHGFSWLAVQSMFVYTIAFVQQHIVAARPGEANHALDAGQVLAIAFAIMNCVGFLVPALALPGISKRLGQVKSHAVSLAMMALAYFGIAQFARSPAMLYVLMVFVGIGWGAIVSLPFAIMSERVGSARTGYFMGLFNLSVVIPQLLVTQFGRLLDTAPDKSLLFSACGATLSISALLWTGVREQLTMTNPEQQAAVPG